MAVELKVHRRDLPSQEFFVGDHPALGDYGTHPLRLYSAADQVAVRLRRMLPEPSNIPPTAADSADGFGRHQVPHGKETPPRSLFLNGLHTWSSSVIDNLLPGDVVVACHREITASGIAHASSFRLRQPAAKRRPSGDTASASTSPDVGNRATNAPNTASRNITCPGRFEPPLPVVARAFMPRPSARSNTPAARPCQSRNGRPRRSPLPD